MFNSQFQDWLVVIVVCHCSKRDANSLRSRKHTCVEPPGTQVIRGKMVQKVADMQLQNSRPTRAVQEESQAGCGIILAMWSL
eukprot:681447-Amphidinium_carterae.1